MQSHGVGDVEAEAELLNRALPRSQSERMLAVYKEHINQERDLLDKYHEMVNYFFQISILHKTKLNRERHKYLQLNGLN